MANEATITSSLQIKSPGTGGRNALDYQSRPSTFRANVTTPRGPTPGLVQALITGTDVSFAALTTPGLMRIANLDPTNFVRWGIYEPSINRFIPVGRLKPLESYVFRLDGTFGNEYGAGTGTTGSGAVFRLKADTAACDVLCECFED